MLAGEKLLRDVLCAMKELHLKLAAPGDGGAREDVSHQYFRCQRLKPMFAFWGTSSGNNSSFIYGVPYLANKRHDLANFACA
ncbi:unnamed protein product [Lampetra fluviatilis]